MKTTLKTHLDWFAVAAIGLLVQTFWALRLPGPTYMDAYYYTVNGQRLADGFGFSEMIIWQFLDNPAGLPNPSHTYWMPLPSILAGVGYRLWNTFGGAQLPFWLLAGLLPLLAFTISRRLVGERWQAWTAALLTATGGYYAAFLNQPTTMAPFAWSAGGCLLTLGLATSRVVPSKSGNRVKSRLPVGKTTIYWLLAGLLAGMAHLTRADGILLLFVGLAIWAISWWQGNRGTDLVGAERTRVRHGLSLVFGYLLIMGGWFIRNWAVSGQPLPAAGAQSVFLTNYADLFAYGRTNDLDGYLAWGLRNIVDSKLQATWLAIQTYIAIPGLIWMGPLIVVAWIRLFRRPTSRLLLRPLTLYAVALFTSMSLLFTFPSMRGTLFHSSVALWPWTTALAAAGIGITVDWIARRLSHWQPAKAKRNFAALFVLVAMVISVVVSRVDQLTGENPETIAYIGSLIPASSVVMAGNPPAILYHTGHPTVSVPNEPIGIVLEAADRYQVRYLILDQHRPVPLNALYSGEEQHARVRLLETVDDVKLYQLTDGSE